MIVLGQKLPVASEWTEAGAASAPGGARALRPRSIEQDEAVRRLDVLTRTIRAEVLPRLVLARQRALRAGSPAAYAGPTASDVLELATIAMTRDTPDAAGFVHSLRLRGATLETLFLELLAPTARHLGELWEQDLADFGTVTVGLVRLHQMLREFGPAFRDEAGHTGRGLHALLAPVPGEQHGFGLSMVAEFFRRGGWMVTGEAMTSRRELVAAVRKRWFAVIGLSLASEVRLEALAASIRALRQASRNQAVSVLVGGPIFVAHPELASLVGADATAIDARLAVVEAQRLLALLPNHV